MARPPSHTVIGVLIDGLNALLDQVLRIAVQAVVGAVRLMVTGSITPSEAQRRAQTAAEAAVRRASKAATAAYTRMIREAGAPVGNVSKLPPARKLDPGELLVPLAAAMSATAQGEDPEAAARQAAESLLSSEIEDARAAARTAVYEQFAARPAGGAGVRYRRVLHPERSKAGQSCGLCVAASMQLYYKADLKPLHAGCNCEVLPVAGDMDPGAVLNREFLDAVYKANADSTDSYTLKHVRVDADGVIVRARRRPISRGAKTSTGRRAPANPSFAERNPWDDVVWLENQLGVVKSIATGSSWRDKMLRDIESRLEELRRAA